MKIPIGRILKWIGRAVAAAALQTAVDRLNRPSTPTPITGGKDVQ